MFARCLTQNRLLRESSAEMEVNMPDLKCTVHNCNYNDNDKNMCKLNSIDVAGGGSSGNTCCASFSDAESTKNSCCSSSARPETDIACEATDCSYNKNCECHAEGIEVCSCGTACQCKDTACETFCK